LNNSVNECPICKSHNFTIIGNENIGYGLVKLDLLNKKVVENPNPEFLPFVVYLCNDCKHIELRNITLNK